MTQSIRRPILALLKTRLAAYDDSSETITSDDDLTPEEKKTKGCLTTILRIILLLVMYLTCPNLNMMIKRIWA